MGKERMQFQPLKEAPQETYVEIKVPASSYHLFNAVMEHPIDGPTEEYVRHIEKSVSINNEMYVMPEIYEDRGAPKGKIHAGKLDDSKFYPGIGHEYWVYVPAQYDPQTPANLVVFYDGGFIMKDAETGAQRENVPTVTMLDNMIAQGKLPVTIALFAAFGEPGPGQPINGFREGVVNRSVEYDTPSDWHARYITEELMPIALGEYNISADPADHVVCGMSSSGVAAFSTAWYKPEIFGKVYTASPSIANIRSGIIWPYAVRVSEKKPIKLFGIVGKHDLEVVFGNWFHASRDFACALHTMGYDHRFYITEAGHSSHVYHCVMPAALEWLFNNTEPQVEHLEEMTHPNLV